MSLRARVIGLGQAAAGDDGVGLAVIEALRAGGVPDGVEVTWAPEDAALVSLLQTPARVVLVDAVLGAASGQVLDLVPEELAARALSPVSTHGLGVERAIALARALAPDALSPDIRIAAITIARPERYAQQLSPEVAAAVPGAVARVRALVEG